MYYFEIRVIYAHLDKGLLETLFLTSRSMLNLRELRLGIVLYLRACPTGES